MALFTTPRCIGGYITNPLEGEGDVTHKIYHLICVVDADAYAAIAQTKVMDTVGNAGVDQFPSFGADATAYFIGDTEPDPFEGPLVKFTRRFATKPSNQSEVLVGSRTFPFPGRGNIIFKVPATEEDSNQEENLYELSVSAANTTPAPLYESKDYWIDGVDTAPTIPATFVPTLGGSPVDYVRNASSKTWTNAKARNGEEFSAAVSLGATSPARTAYETDVTAGTKKVVEVNIERYAGKIFVMKTYKMAAQ